MNSTEKYGTDVETAVQLALDELGVGIDDVEVEVLDEPTRGFLGTGLGAKLAFVRVTRKEPEEEPVKESPKKNKEKPKAKEKKGSKPQREKNNRNHKERDNHSKESQSKNSQQSDIDSGSVEELKEELILDEPITPVVDISSLQDLGENAGLDFLKQVVEAMGIEVSITGKTDGKDIYMFMDGKESGTIIGKRGATLDAIQYLTSLVVNKEGGDYTRVVVDAENYRAKREKTLEKLAVRMADKVVRSRRSFKLEPMNPYERKVIHATLQKDGRVVTRSEGQDPARRVVIELK